MDERRAVQLFLKVIDSHHDDIGSVRGDSSAPTHGLDSDALVEIFNDLTGSVRTEQVISKMILDYKEERKCKHCGHSEHTHEGEQCYGWKDDRPCECSPEKYEAKGSCDG